MKVKDTGYEIQTKLAFLLLIGLILLAPVIASAIPHGSQMNPLRSSNQANMAAADWNTNWQDDGNGNDGLWHSMNFFVFLSGNAGNFTTGPVIGGTNWTGNVANTSFAIASGQALPQAVFSLAVSGTDGASGSSYFDYYGYVDGTPVEGVRMYLDSGVWKGATQGAGWDYLDLSTAPLIADYAHECGNAMTIGGMSVNQLSAGLQGAAGPAGADGAAGPQGPAGPQGIQGVAGTAGADGAVGPQGPAGADGATGSQGPTGLTGATGAQGPQGIQGAAGPAGADGAVGPQGPQGPAGLDGLGGANGLACWDLNADNVCDVTEDVNLDGVCDAHDCQGSQGPIGQTGSQGPAGSDGAVGPQGAAGAVGPQGQKGDTGAQGTQGLQGLQGPIGLTGPAGAAGTQGAAGPAGTSSWADGTGKVTTTQMVGIGTSTPDQLLHVKNNVNALAAVRIENANILGASSPSAQEQIVLGPVGNEHLILQVLSDSQASMPLVALINAYTHNLYIRTNAQNVMKVIRTGAVADTLVLNAGNVGIGTAAPAQKLDVVGNVSFGGGSANRAICWKSDGKTLGYCSTAIASNGSCTCN